MNDLISRLSEIRSQYNCFDEADEPYYRALSVAIKALSAQPEIIQCLECEYWDTSWQNKDWLPDCHYCPIMDGVRKSDFYCADAKRRTE